MPTTYRDNYPHNIEAPQRVYVQYSQDINFDYSGGKYPLGETYEGFIWETIYNPTPHYIGANLIGRHTWMRWRIGEKENWTLPMRLTDSISNIETTVIEYTQNPSQIKFKFKYTLNTGEIIYSEYMYLPMPEDGVGITSSEIIGTNLFLTYSNGVVQNVGRVVGYDGNGLPVTETNPGEIPYVDGDGNIIWISLTDLTTNIIDSYITATSPIEINSGVITHLDTDGNKHIPIGGSNGNVLTTNGAGVYSWEDFTGLVNNNITDITNLVVAEIIDDTSGTGDTDVTWSADKLTSMFASINVYGLKYAVALISDLAGIVGMVSGDQAVVNEDRWVYRYNGSAWIQFYQLDVTHNHNDLYYTKNELNVSLGGGQVHWNNITNTPTFYQNWTIAGTTGSTQIDTGETLSIVGGSGVTTSLVGNTLTINAAGTTYTEGTAIDIVANAISHEDTSSVTNVTNAGGFVIKNLTYDGMGHVQSQTNVDLHALYAFKVHSHETLTRGVGLTGSNYDGSAGSTWDVDFAGTGAANTVSRSDHSHTYAALPTITSLIAYPVIEGGGADITKFSYSYHNNLVTVTGYGNFQPTYPSGFPYGPLTHLGDIPAGYIASSIVSCWASFTGTDGSLHEVMLFIFPLGHVYAGRIYTATNAITGLMRRIDFNFVYNIIG